MKITKWGECGVLCCIQLGESKPDSIIGAAEIAGAIGIDHQYTHQILHRLKKGGIIESVRGPHGGYRLARSPEEISLKDILYASEGVTFEIFCDETPIVTDQSSPQFCGSDKNCSLRHVWHELRDSIDKLLQAKSLASLLNRPEELVHLSVHNR